MVQINFAQKSVTVKIVYYGPGMSGKTTNLEVVHQRAPENSRGDLTSISTDGDRTLFFDFMPLDLGTVAGMRTQFQIYTVPGQVYYNSTRKLVLQGVDGVIFIADSSASMTQENLESLSNLEENLAEYGKDINTIPMVIQWNKRDLPDALPTEELEKNLNPRGVPTFDGVANTGQGVFPTLKALAALVLDSIHEQAGTDGGGGGAEGIEPAPEPTPAPAPAMPTQAEEEPAPVPEAAPPVTQAATGFYEASAAASAAQPPVQSAGTGFYPSPTASPAQQAPPQPPVPAVPQAAPTESVPPTAIPQPTVLPQPGGGVPAGFPQPGAPPMAQPAQAAGQPMAQPAQAAGQPMAQPTAQQPMAQPGQQVMPDGVPPLRIAQQPQFGGPVGGVPQSPMGAARGVPQPPASLAHAGHTASPAPRIKPRSSALPTPSQGSGSKSTMITVVFVVVALAAGVGIGGFAFGLF